MTAVDFAEIALEENPIYEGAVAVGGTGPNRISTNLLYMPGRTVQIGASTQYKDRSDEFRSILGAVPKLLDHYEPSGSLTEFAYWNDLAFLLPLCGFTGSVTAGGTTTTDPDSTTATSVNALNSATVNVGSTALFPSTGSFMLGGVATTYTGITATSFTGCGTHVATTGGETISNNVPAGASKWVFTKRAGITAKTAQLRLNYANEAVMMKGNGFACSQLQMSGEGELSATLLGLVAKRTSVDTSTTPSYTTSAVPPIRRGDLYLSFLTGGGDISDFSWQIDNPLTAVRTMSLLPPSNYPDKMEFGDQQAKLTGTIPKRFAAAVDLDAVLAATVFAAKARYKSPKVIGATAYPYSMWIEMPAAQYTAGTIDALANVRRKGIPDLAFEAAYDETSGFDVKITIINSVTAVETYT